MSRWFIVDLMCLFCVWYASSLLLVSVTKRYIAVLKLSKNDVYLFLDKRNFYEQLVYFLFTQDDPYEEISMWAKQKHKLLVAELLVPLMMNVVTLLVIGWGFIQGYQAGDSWQVTVKLIMFVLYIALNLVVLQAAHQLRQSHA
jgi:hypothetical protein